MEQRAALDAFAALQRHVLGAYAALLDAYAGAREREAGEPMPFGACAMRATSVPTLPPAHPLGARAAPELYGWRATPPAEPRARIVARVDESAQTDFPLPRSRATQSDAGVADERAPPSKAHAASSTAPRASTRDMACDAEGRGVRSWAVRTVDAATEPQHAGWPRERGVQVQPRTADAGSLATVRTASTGTLPHAQLVGVLPAFGAAGAPPSGACGSEAVRVHDAAERGSGSHAAASRGVRAGADAADGVDGLAAGSADGLAAAATCASPPAERTTSPQPLGESPPAHGSRMWPPAARTTVATTVGAGTSSSALGKPNADAECARAWPPAARTAAVALSLIHI